MRKLVLQFFLMGVMISLKASPFPAELPCLPVLIKIPLTTHTSFGTGIYLSESNKLFLVTAAHCIFETHTTNRSQLINTNATASSLLPQREATDKEVITLDLKKLNETGLIKRHPSRDVVVIFIATTKALNNSVVTLDTFAPGVKRPPLAGRGTTYFTTDVCTLFTNVFEGNETYILGYPVELFNKKFPPEVDFEHPVVRKGIVSQKNKLTRKLIIDSGVYGGNSGGPVLVANDISIGVTEFKVIGLMTQFVPVETRIIPQAGMTNSVIVNSGYGVAEPIDFALELIRQY
jgi:hypothetical protein